MGAARRRRAGRGPGSSNSPPGTLPCVGFEIRRWWRWRELDRSFGETACGRRRPRADRSCRRRAARRGRSGARRRAADAVEQRLIILVRARARREAGGDLLRRGPVWRAVESIRPSSSAGRRPRSSASVGVSASMSPSRLASGRRAASRRNRSTTLGRRLTRVSKRPSAWPGFAPRPKAAMRPGNRFPAPPRRRRAESGLWPRAAQVLDAGCGRRRDRRSPPSPGGAPSPRPRGEGGWRLFRLQPVIDCADAGDGGREPGDLRARLARPSSRARWSSAAGSMGRMCGSGGRPPSACTRCSMVRSRR